MNIILAQRIDYESEYDDTPFEVYHFPKRYRNQIRPGDTFIYYQGDRHNREHRYYFGCGIVGKIVVSQDGQHFYAHLLDGHKFKKAVPLYMPAGGFFESLGYDEVRGASTPSWRSSIRKISQEAFNAIISAAE